MLQRYFTSMHPDDLDLICVGHENPPETPPNGADQTDQTEFLVAVLKRTTRNKSLHQAIMTSNLKYGPYSKHGRNIIKTAVQFDGQAVWDLLDKVFNTSSAQTKLNWSRIFFNAIKLKEKGY